ncbi:MAG: hypothetical protein IKZ65_04300 [Lachnospiraceae bacterium]|nr:hypothetical protein [Lachnospiraceae bacterium]
MSQAKVDAYKNEKANRKENMKKDKRMGVIRALIATCLVIALVAWAGFSLYGNISNQEKSQAIAVDYEDISDYINTLQ